METLTENKAYATSHQLLTLTNGRFGYDWI